jgi:3-oxoacyl-[acyl-carrier protein] reductase
MNKIALITGGTRGIGLGIAKQLGKNNYNLALCGTRPKDQLNQLIIELKNEGITAEYFQCNIGVAEDRKRLVQEVVKHYGQINVLVNNAGIAPKVRADMLETSEESFDDLISVNLKGPFFLTQTVANEMIKQTEKDPSYKACIINVTSVSSSVASINRPEYCISKSGSSMSTMLWASRLGEYSIPVYELQPGIIKTDMTSGVSSKYDKLIEETDLLVQKRWGLPEDIGKAALGLAEGYFPFSTGAVIPVDGGLMLKRL